MSIPRRAAKRDDNEAEIVTALEQCGASVVRLSMKGVPDLDNMNSIILTDFEGQVRYNCSSKSCSRAAQTAGNVRHRSQPVPTSNHTSSSDENQFRNPSSKTCPICGKEFRVKPSHYNKRTYCSKACMAEGYKTQMAGENNPHYSNASLRTCEVCGKEYHNYSKTRKYCSDRCKGKAPENLARLQWMAKRPRKYIHTSTIRAASHKRSQSRNTCVTCGTEFYWPNKRKYCADCSPYGKHTTRICQICGAEFHSYADRKTCSVKCNRLRLSISQQGEKSHRWQGGKTAKTIKARRLPGYRMWRESVFERDDYTCQLCSERGGKLTAHHIKLFSQHPEHALDTGNGITLCWSCHSGIRNKEAQYEEQFFAITGGLQALALLGAEGQ